MIPPVRRGKTVPSAPILAGSGKPLPARPLRLFCDFRERPLSGPATFFAWPGPAVMAVVPDAIPIPGFVHSCHRRVVGLLPVELNPPAVMAGRVHSEHDGVAGLDRPGKVVGVRDRPFGPTTHKFRFPAAPAGLLDHEDAFHLLAGPWRRSVALLAVPGAALADVSCEPVREPALPRAYRLPVPFGQRPDPLFDTHGHNSVTAGSDRVTERLGPEHCSPRVLGQGYQRWSAEKVDPRASATPRSVDTSGSAKQFHHTGQYRRGVRPSQRAASRTSGTVEEPRPDR